jgi:tetratricopeptide (TPR) repeat protein
MMRAVRYFYAFRAMSARGVLAMHTQGRNDPCPCGSGKKYKKCCLPDDTRPDTHLDEVEKTRVKALKNMSEENWEEAIAQFKSIENQVEDSWTVSRALASCYDAMDDYLRASEYYEKARAAAPGEHRFDLTYHLGISRGCAGRIDKAIAAFHEAVDLAPNPQQKDQLRLILDTLHQIKLGNENPNLFVVHVHLQRAFSEIEAKRYAAAASRLERLIQLDPENPAIFYNLAVVYTFMNREDEAMAAYEKTVDLNPDYVQAWYNLGQLCMIKKKDFSHALHCFDRALAIRPDYVSAHHQRGMAWELLGDRHKALECWRKTLELDPKNRLAMENIERVGSSVSGESSPAEN